MPQVAFGDGGSPGPAGRLVLPMVLGGMYGDDDDEMWHPPSSPDGLLLTGRIAESSSQMLVDTPNKRPRIR